MIRLNRRQQKSSDSIPIDSAWNTGDTELKMHRIHAYPAKFPAFITTKALEFARKRDFEILRAADIFCGCGTVAFEAKRNNIQFWGCDINPVATMIAKVKSHKYQTQHLEQYYETILAAFIKTRAFGTYDIANQRLKYWYDRKHYQDLYRLRSAIEASTPKRSKYRDFFICAFSNILKPTSRWLTKSIKPQLDPEKGPAAVKTAFQEQCEWMMKANEKSDIANDPVTKIVTGSFLDASIQKPKVDMIITSPPYVTSYEYADLHQLPSLWLGFAEDYRELRVGSIGSLHHVYNFEKSQKHLNETGRDIVTKLLDQQKSKARSVAKYFLDMQQVASKCRSMLAKRGIAVFVIGNTEYKGVRIDNARHLAESLWDSGFKSVWACKRQITGKILTP